MDWLALTSPKTTQKTEQERIGNRVWIPTNPNAEQPQTFNNNNNNSGSCSSHTSTSPWRLSPILLKSLDLSFELVLVKIISTLAI